MPATKPQLVRKVIKISEQNQEMLTEMVEKKGIVSESEAIRQAITFWYEKKEPEYLKPSPRQQKELEEMREKERIEDMSPEEFTTEIMKGRVFTAIDGKKYAVIMNIGNTVRITPLDQIKDLDARDSFFRENHLKMLAEGADFDAYLKRSAFKLRQSKIDTTDIDGVSLQETKTNNDQSQWNNKEGEDGET